MKYLVTIRVVNEFTMQVSAKDEEVAEEKAIKEWEKACPNGFFEIDHSRLGKLEHTDESFDIEVEEDE